MTVAISAARVRVSLNPRQMVHIDSAESKSINLQCGDYAETLALVDNSKFDVSWSFWINPRSIGTSAHVASLEKVPSGWWPEGHLWHFHRRQVFKGVPTNIRRKRHAEDRPRNSIGSHLRRADWRRGSGGREMR